MDTHLWPVGELTEQEACAHERACACPLFVYARRIPNKDALYMQLWVYLCTFQYLCVFEDN